jgi:N12 class adenine-specific DNA methylase
MPWEDIQKDPRWPTLPRETQEQVADKYFQKHIAADPRYGTLPPEEQARARDNFMKTLGPKPEGFLERAAKAFSTMPEAQGLAPDQAVMQAEGIKPVAPMPVSTATLPPEVTAPVPDIAPILFDTSTPLSLTRLGAAIPRGIVKTGKSLSSLAGNIPLAGGPVAGETTDPEAILRDIAEKDARAKIALDLQQEAFDQDKDLKISDKTIDERLAAQGIQPNDAQPMSPIGLAAAAKQGIRESGFNKNLENYYAKAFSKEMQPKNAVESVVGGLLEFAPEMLVTMPISGAGVTGKLTQKGAEYIGTKFGPKVLGLVENELGQNIIKYMGKTATRGLVGGAEGVHYEAAAGEKPTAQSMKESAIGFAGANMAFGALGDLLRKIPAMNRPLGQQFNEWFSGLNDKGKERVATAYSDLKSQGWTDEDILKNFPDVYAMFKKAAFTKGFTGVQDTRKGQEAPKEAPPAQITEAPASAAPTAPPVQPPAPAKPVEQAPVNVSEIAQKPSSPAVPPPPGEVPGPKVPTLSEYANRPTRMSDGLSFAQWQEQVQKELKKPENVPSQVIEKKEPETPMPLKNKDTLARGTMQPSVPPAPPVGAIPPQAAPVSGRDEPGGAALPTEAGASRARLEKALVDAGHSPGDPVYEAAMAEHRHVAREVDAVTGYQPGDYRPKALERIKNDAVKSGKPASMGSIDLRNLGGLNKHLGGEAKANLHVRAIADLLKSTVERDIGMPAQWFKQGGDEYTVVANVPQNVLDSALERANIAVEGYAKGMGLHEIPHPKSKPEAPIPSGIGIYHGTADLVKSRSIDDAILEAETNVYKRKEASYGTRRGDVGQEVRPDTSVEPAGEVAPSPERKAPPDEEPPAAAPAEKVTPPEPEPPKFALDVMTGIQKETAIGRAKARGAEKRTPVEPDTPKGTGIAKGDPFTLNGRRYELSRAEEGDTVAARDMTGAYPISRSWGSIADFEKQTGLKIKQETEPAVPETIEPKAERKPAISETEVPKGETKVAKSGPAAPKSASQRLLERTKGKAKTVDTGGKPATIEEGEKVYDTSEHDKYTAEPGEQRPGTEEPGPAKLEEKPAEDVQGIGAEWPSGELPDRSGAGDVRADEGTRSEALEAGVRPEPSAPERVGDGEGEPDTTAAGERGNYRITDQDAVGQGGLKQKFKDNIAAIELLKKLEAEKRLAHPEEQAILVKYVGWGGMPQVFDWRNAEWAKERDILEKLVGEDEYDAARASTTNAHYTSPEVIRGMWSALERMGFKGGRVLEPSMGVGHFFGLMPDAIAKRSKMTGIELDKLTGAIAENLYQNADIRVNGFEREKLPDNFYDLAVSNVPFGDYKLNDPRYNKYNFRIHDYFFAKALDKVRPGGVVAFITSRYTMDKQDSKVRDYLAERADLIGAIRLPDTAFLKNANTEVTTDIIFLKKRAEGVPASGPAWSKAIDKKSGDTGYHLNEYFVEHPDMMLGTMKAEGTMYHENNMTLKPGKTALPEALSEAAAKLPENIIEQKKMIGKEPEKVAAPSSMKAGSFVVEKGKIMRNVGGSMEPYDAKNEGEAARIKGMIELRDTVKDLIRKEMDPQTGAMTVKTGMGKLNSVYDRFVRKFGPVSNQANKRAFQEDPEAALLLSLEKYDRENKTAAKSDIFTTRVINPKKEVATAETAKDALLITLNEKGTVDFDHMRKITGKTEKQLSDELEGMIFNNPDGEAWETADQYLSGNVREKLKIAEAAARTDKSFAQNVEALKNVRPEDLEWSDIDARLGSSWIATSDIKDFVHYIADVSSSDIKVNYLPMLGQWIVDLGRSKWAFDRSASNLSKWGMGEYPATNMIEDALNHGLPTIWQGPSDARTVDIPKTEAAREKQYQIKEEFKKWLWKDEERRTRLAKKYNEEFNNIRLRKYDGSHLTFPGMAMLDPDKPQNEQLRPHQKDAVWRGLQDGTVLYAHVVGSGKTFTIVAVTKEGRRMGLFKKPMIVVPNHLVEQWRNEYLTLYPNSKILVADETDFTPLKRKTFMSRIATGDWDAVIVPHSSFGKLPMSRVAVEDFISKQIADYRQAIDELIASGEGKKSRTVKQIEKAVKRLEQKLESKVKEEKRDTAIDFEELGVDFLAVDEAHLFKNLMFATKMTRVGGISGAGSDRASDLYMKSQWLLNKQKGRGVVFATGTPIANSMAEMFTMQRYLQPDTLTEHHIGHFDSWANDFGEVVSSLELAPEGTGYRVKSRFAKFTNLPELMQMFRSVADVQTAEMLKLPTPTVKGGKAEVVKAPGSRALLAYIQLLAKRAEKIRSGSVDPHEDNMLKVTNDGRKAALDMRLIDLAAGDFEQGKVNAGVENIIKIYKETAKNKSTQLVFIDLSTPHKDRFNVYDDMKEKLVRGGIPKDEIAFIHDADTRVKKQQLFGKVNSGKVRILFGSTEKMGAGMNVQHRLIAKHDLDAPWRPADLEQRDGRIVRQGNMNDEVQLYRYVTEGSFDAYMWQILENKARFISQVMTDKLSARSADDIESAALTYAETKALASGNPLIIDKVKVDTELRKIQSLYASYKKQQYETQDKLSKLPLTIERSENNIAAFEKDLKTRNLPEEFSMIVDGKTYDKREDAGRAISSIAGKMKGTDQTQKIGKYAGFDLYIQTVAADFLPGKLIARGQRDYTGKISETETGSTLSLDYALKSIETYITTNKGDIATAQKQLKTLTEIVGKPFEYESKMHELVKKQKEIDGKLDLNKSDVTEGLEGEPEGKEVAPVEPSEEEPAPEEEMTPSEEKPPVKGEKQSGLSEVMYKGQELYSFPANIVEAVKKMLSPTSRKVNDDLVMPSGGLGSENPDVEARWQAAKLTKATLIDKLKEGTQHTLEQRKHFPGLDYKKDAEVINILRNYENVPEYSRYMAVDITAAITEGLGPKKYDVFTRNIILPDLIKDIENGLYGDERDLPFGYADLGEVQADLRKYQEIAEMNPDIQAAINNRENFHTSLTQELVDAGLLSEKVLEDDRYFHHQVIAYMDVKHVGASSGDVRTHKKGWQRGRIGSSQDYNTDYLEAEYQYIAQALSQLETRVTLDALKKTVDVSDKLKKEAKKKSTEDNPVDWKDLLPDGYTLWQPKQGNAFYHAISIPDRIIEEVLAGNQNLTAEDLKDVLAMGKKLEQWAIPDHISETLDNFRNFDKMEGFDHFTRAIMATWKQWTLLNPIRVFRYNLNNMSGDLDIALAYDPRILGYFKQGATDAWHYYKHGTLTDDMNEALKYGLINTGLTVQEIPDIKTIGAFRRLTGKDDSNVLDHYWEATKGLTQFRENILRMAAFKYFVKELQSGKKLYGASKPELVDAEKDVKKKAAMLARDLIGDYGNISAAGKWLRERVIAFWSWMEINAPRYVRLLQNAKREEGASGPKRAATMAALGTARATAKFGVKALMLFGLITILNEIARRQFNVSKEEMDQLYQNRNQLQLVIGRREDGSIQTLRFQGALSDALDWVGAGNAPQDIKDLATGKKTWAEQGKEMVKAPMNRLVNASHPMVKTGFEVATGESLYPDVTRPKPIRDKSEHVARLFSLDAPYRFLAGKPTRGAKNELLSAILYSNDPGEAAYWNTRKAVGDWNKEHGQEAGITLPTEKDNALYYYKQALKYNDQDAEKKYLKEYVRLGGTPFSAWNSIQAGKPVGSLSFVNQALFKKTLTEGQKRELTLSEEWYKKTFQNGKRISFKDFNDAKKELKEEGAKIIAPQIPKLPHMIVR